MKTLSTSKKAIYGVIGVLLLIFPLVVRSQYQVHLMVLAGIFVILASGLNLLSGYVGLLSLTHGAFLGLGAYISAMLSKNYGTPFLLNFLLAGVLTAVISYLFGLVSLRVRGAAFIIMTMSFLQILHLLALNLVKFTQGQMGIGNIPRAKIFGYVFASKTSYYYLVLAVCVISIYIIYRLVNSRIGRAWITIRENEDLAKSVGVDVFSYANLAFVIGAFFAGLAGSLYAHYITFISPDLFLFAITTELLVMMIMGGKGTITGPIIGAIVFSMLPEYLRIAAKWRMPIFGAILVIGIIFLPNGIVKLPNQIVEWRRRRAARESEEREITV